MNPSDTIAAIATPIGSGSIGVIRISGPLALDSASRVFPVASDLTHIPSHTAHHGVLVHPESGEPIDEIVMTLFHAPTSYTGEDVVEISCHGGIATVRAVLEAVLATGARLASPGEFTKRAFLNGKIDLAQAEAVNDVIRARTDEARKVALRQLEGELSARIRGISGSILGVIARVEAAIDFPEDVEEPDINWLESEIITAHAGIDELLVSFGRGRVLREGLRLVIAGRVNVGKSSLLNALLGRARAIVTPIPGTTRDVIEESLEIRGIPIVAMDTAGIRDTDDLVERLGVERTNQSVESADVVLMVVDASAPLTDEDVELARSIRGRHAIVALNKVDLLDEAARAEVSSRCAEKLGGSLPIVQTSASQMGGIDDLEGEIKKLAGITSQESALLSNVRHEIALESAAKSLDHVLSALQEPIDLLSVDLNAARISLGLITGETATDDLLERIFSEFCIGK